MAKLKIAEMLDGSAGGDGQNGASDLAEATRLLAGARAWADLLSCAALADVELDSASLANGGWLLAQTLERVAAIVEKEQCGTLRSVA